MKKVILIHQKKIQHYRVSIYNYLSNYLEKNNFKLSVISEGIQDDNPYSIDFTYFDMHLTFRKLTNFILKEKPFAVIYFINPGNWYLYPLIMYLRTVGIKVIYWGHGIDLQDEESNVKMFFNRLLHRLSDALILYSEELKNNINPTHHKKIFISNNTLNFETVQWPENFDRKLFLEQEGIKTTRNIIFSGRVQKRKRIEDLLDAFKIINREDTGLIIIGPLDRKYEYIANLNKKNIYYIGPCYGIKALQFLKASDVYCIPGAIGLSIVDAQFCGLPVVTEDVQHGPEFMYFKEGINGFKVPVGNTKMLAEKLNLLLNDHILINKFSKAAKNENKMNGHIDSLCYGFIVCLKFLASNK